MSNIGFIGLGHMGAPMAINLIKAGHRVFAFDLATEALNTLADAGATTCDNVATLADQSEIVITMLQTGAQVFTVTQNDDGVFAHLAPGKLFIDCSTIDIDTCRQVHTLAKEKNIDMLDAPVSGGVGGATHATLTFMVGGDAKTFNKAKPILDCMGKNMIHAGDAGNGQVAKICNNMLLGISMIGVSEAFTLGEKLGLDAKTLFDISSKSSGQCWSMTSYSPAPGCVDSAPSNNNYKAGFSANMMLKDLRLSQEASANAKAHTPLGALATTLYEEYADQGNGEIDFSGIIKMLSQPESN